MFFNDEGQATPRLSLRKNEFVTPVLAALAAGISPASAQFLKPIFTTYGVRAMLTPETYDNLDTTPHLAAALSEARQLVSDAGPDGVDPDLAVRVLAVLAAGVTPNPKKPSLQELFDKNGISALLEATALSEFCVAPTLQHALAEARHVLQVASGWGMPAKLLSDFRKKYLKAILAHRVGYPAVSPQSADDVSALLAFASDLLFASPDKSAAHFVLTAGLSPLPAALRETLLPPARKLVATLNTHDSKAAHSSAQQEACFLTQAQPSRYLSSAVLGFELGGRVGGGALQYASWAIDLLGLPVAWGGKTFTVYDALSDEALQAELAAAGVTVVTDFLGARMPAIYRPTMAGTVRMKVGDRSLELTLLPANSMFAATEALAAAMYHKAKHKRIQHLEAQLATLVGPDIAFPRELLDACANGNPATKKRAANGLAAEAKAQSVKLSVADIEALPSPRGIRSWVPRVATVGSNPFNCGSAYGTHSSKGPFRFPAAHDTKQSSAAVRRFHAKLTPAFKDWVSKLKPQANLADKYQVGNRWLPIRIQRARMNVHADKAAARYLELLQRFVSYYELSAEDLLDIPVQGLSAIQQYVVAGAAADPDALRELALAGTRLLNSTEAAAHDAFIEKVLERCFLLKVSS